MISLLPFLLLPLTTASDLLAYSFWSAFDQGIYDQAGNNNHGVNGFSLSLESKDAIMTPQGAYFDESWRVITVPGNELQGNKVPIGLGFTLLWWVWPSNSTGVLLDKTAIGLPLIRVEMQAGVLATSLQLNGTVQTVNSTSLVHLEAWSMLTVTVMCSNTSSICIVNQYINGVNAGITDISLPGTLVDDPNLSVYLGAMGDQSAHYKGYMYQFKWIDGALLPSDVAGLYGAAGATICSGCLYECVVAPFQCLPAIIPGQVPVPKPACDTICHSLCIDNPYTCFAMSPVCNSSCITCLTQPLTQCLTCSLPSAVADTATHTCICRSGYVPTSLDPLTCTSNP